MPTYRVSLERRIIESLTLDIESGSREDLSVEGLCEIATEEK